MNRLIAWMLLITLTGCATTDTQHGAEPKGAGSESDPVEEVVGKHLSDGPAGDGADATDTDPDETEPVTEPRLYKGNDRAVNMPAPRDAIELEGSGVTLNFEQAPITEVVHSILGEILELDYVVEHPLKGEITLRTRSPVPRDQLLPILESLLQSNGIIMVRDPNNRYFVSASKNLPNLLPGVTSPETEGAGYANVIIPLEYIAATEMAEILKPVAPGSAFVRVDSRRNLLVLAGTRNQLDGWMQIINTFDVNQLKGMSVGIFPLENTEVADVEAALNQIMRAEGEKPTGLASMIRVLPLEQLNSIMVVTPRAHYLDQVRTWVERLDQAQATSDEPKLHVYSVQNGSATHLARLLGQVFGGGGFSGDDGSNRARDEGVSPGFTPMGSDSSSSRSGGSSMDMPSSGNNESGPKGASVALGDNIRVVADEYNNSLLIYAPEQAYRKIEKALKQLDILPTQVLIEASIIEVTLSDDLQYGVEWFIENELSGGREGDATLDLFGESGLGAIGQGFSYTVQNKAGTLRAVVNALAEKSMINVISTPSVMVLDNNTAFIHVGDQQPIQSGSVVGDGGDIVTTSINYKDTGVKLEVKPSVNAGGMVTMQVKQSVTDVGEVDSATGQRAFLERNVSSRVAIRSGESVVLGGLIRDNQTTGKSGIPLLHEIPVLGNLFGQTTTNSRRTELLVFLTPRVIKNEQDLRDITAEMRARMKGLDNFEDLPLESMPEAATEKTEQTE